MPRFFSTLPALLAWSTIMAMFLFSWLAPAWVAVFIIFFDIYWLLKTIYLSFHLQHTFQKMRANLKIDWLSRLKSLPPSSDRPHWEDIYHLVVIPFYKEPYEVVAESLESLLAGNYSSDRLIVALGGEERAQEHAREIITRARRDYSDKFFRLFTTLHPAGLPGELAGKGSNSAWIARRAKEEIIDTLNLSYENIITSVFDVDTQVPSAYFGILAYAFLTNPDRQRASYQPIPFFTNNIFATPALGRVVSFSATFWQMMQQARPERLTTFSSHAVPFQALVDVDFWETDLVSEDSRIFWQCFFRYDGWRVVPLNCPVYMDSNVASTFWRTMKNIYLQQRRWGWGVENIPYMLSGFVTNRRLRFSTKLYWSFITLEGFHSWATNALIIFALGWLPLFLGGADFNYSVLSYSLPEVTRFIMMLAMVGIASSAVVSVILLPPRPAWFRWYHYFLYLVQWLLMPLTLIIFGAIPGLEAQTRLALGGRFRLGFWVTPKYRENK